MTPSVLIACCHCGELPSESSPPSESSSLSESVSASSSSESESSSSSSLSESSSIEVIDRVICGVSQLPRKYKLTISGAIRLKSTGQFTGSFIPYRTEFTLVWTPAFLSWHSEELVFDEPSNVFTFPGGLTGSGPKIFGLRADSTPSVDSDTFGYVTRFGPGQAEAGIHSATMRINSAVIEGVQSCRFAIALYGIKNTNSNNVSAVCVPTARTDYYAPLDTFGSYEFTSFTTACVQPPYNGTARWESELGEGPSTARIDPI